MTTRYTGGHDFDLNRLPAQRDKVTETPAEVRYDLKYDLQDIMKVS